MENLSFRLRTGDPMPKIGFGTWKIPKQTGPQVVYNAIKTGYRLFNCAGDYGNQVQVGQGIKRALDQGIVTRKQLFITSKLWHTFHRPDHVQIGFRKSLADLGLEYLDLYMIHFPISLKFVDPNVRYPPKWIHDDKVPEPVVIEDDVSTMDTWRAFQELVRKGLVRNIGLSNFNVALIREVLVASTIKPAVLQVQIHPYLTQKKLLRYCRQKQIHVIGYSTFGPTSYVQLNIAKSEQSIISHETIKELAEKYKRTPGQILLRWGAQQQIVVVPKTVNIQRMKQNMDIFSWELSSQDMQIIDSFNKNKRYNDPGVNAQRAWKKFYPVFQ